MNANYIIINRDEALSVLETTEKRCSSRTFDDLETVEEALKNLLDESGHSKTCNRKLKGFSARVGETTGENHWITYSRKHRYPNSNQTTYVDLIHTGKGWKLIKAERGYTDWDSFLRNAEETAKYLEEELAEKRAKEEQELTKKKAKEEREKALKEAAESFGELVRKSLSVVSADDIKCVSSISNISVDTVLNHIVAKRIEREYGYVKDVHLKMSISDKIPYFRITAKYFDWNLNETIETKVSLLDDNFLCVDCDDCTGCFLCDSCQGCTFCGHCLLCYDCDWCQWCKKCEDCRRCVNQSDISPEEITRCV